MVYCCLIGCDSGSNDDSNNTNKNTVKSNTISADTYNNPANFSERQKQLFYEIDHELVYQSCQELMRTHREGNLSSNVFFIDDNISKLNELPEPIRLLKPTYVHVLEVMVTIGFFNKDGMQSLLCFSNEFGQPESPFGEAKGWGWRIDPVEMDKLSGKESLDYLNESFDHFEMELVRGLQYQSFKEEQPATLEEVKQSIKRSNQFFEMSWKVMDELAVKKQRLLHQTDHHALLEACRQVITHYKDGVFSTDKINIMSDRSASDLKNIPEIILNLEPVYVWLDENSAMVALIGGLDHVGIVAYVKNEEAIARDDAYQLIDGLLYYDDGLGEADDDYKEYLNSLEKEAIPYLDWKRKQKNLLIPVKIK